MAKNGAIKPPRSIKTNGGKDLAGRLRQVSERLQAQKAKQGIMYTG